MEQSLNYRVVGESGPIVVLMHGFGAPGTDLVPLANYLGAGRRYVFPEAPLTLPPMFGPGRAWWMLDLERLQRAMITGVPRDLSAEYPDGLPRVRESLNALLADLDPEGNAPMVIGGFSQGAMLACDVALHAGRKFSGVCLLSGSLVAKDWWLPKMSGLGETPIFQSHGEQDSVLAFEGAEALRNALTDAGATVDWTPFRGGHEIPGGVLQAMKAFLQKVL